MYIYIFLYLIYNFYNFYHYISTYTRNSQPLESLEFGDPVVEAMMEKSLGWRVRVAGQSYCGWASEILRHLGWKKSWLNNEIYHLVN